MVPNITLTLALDDMLSDIEGRYQKIFEIKIKYFLKTYFKDNVDEESENMESQGQNNTLPTSLSTY